MSALTGKIKALEELMTPDLATVLLMFFYDSLSKAEQDELIILAGRDNYPTIEVYLEGETIIDRSNGMKKIPTTRLAEDQKVFIDYMKRKKR